MAQVYLVPNRLWHTLAPNQKWLETLVFPHFSLLAQDGTSKYTHNICRCIYARKSQVGEVFDVCKPVPTLEFCFKSLIYKGFTGTRSLKTKLCQVETKLCQVIW